MNEQQGVVKEEESTATIVIVCPNCKATKSFKIGLQSEVWFMFCSFSWAVCGECRKEFLIEDNIDYGRSVFPKFT